MVAMSSEIFLVSSKAAVRFSRIRAKTLGLVAGLSAEDLLVQSMPDASPGKWHLAHTSWFFEQFVLGYDPAYRPREPAWHYLFNSYYESVGSDACAAATRPAVATLAGRSVWVSALRR
jgi:hypothetical protein